MKSIITLLIISLTTVVTLAQSSLTAKQWQEDLRYLQKHVHAEYPFLFKKVTAEKFDAEADKLYNAIPTMKEHEIRVGFSRMVSLFGYGHTQIPFSSVAKNGILPINLYHFNDGIYIEGVHKDHKAALGAKVLKIGDTPIDKALALVKPVVPVENDFYYKAYGIRFLGTPEVLHAQGVISELTDSVRFTLEKNGKTFEYAFPTIAYKDKPKHFNFTLPTDNWITARQTDKTPLYLKHHADLWYYFDYMEDSKTLYVKQSSVFNHEKESLADFYKRLFEFIDANPIDKLIYDVRLNGGGNNYNNLALIKGLMARPKVNTRGKFFYIIGRDTFSACQNLTNEITRYTEAILVGEPTAENVNFYGDTRPVKLKNSELTAYLSYAWWQDRAAWENSDSSLPNIAADMSFSQYVNNEDPALESIMSFEDNGFILDPLEHLTLLFSQQKFAQLKTDAGKIAQSPHYKYYDFEKEFSKAGDRLMSIGETQGGVFVYELITENYPKSTGAWYALANGYEEMKLVEKATDAYAKIVELAPNGSLAKAAKNRIEALSKK